MSESVDVAALYLLNVRARMQGVKALGDGALAQLREHEIGTALSAEGNSAGVLVQHLAGNMRSRWGGLRLGYSAAVEGEAGTRNRDAEFEPHLSTWSELQAAWEGGWDIFFAALEHLTPADLTRTLTIRGEVHTVLEAVQRQVAHYSGHVYQLIFLVKTLRGTEWQILSIARGESAAFNAQMHSKRGQKGG
ncbi:DUF1572 family protein [Deinococcus oregonensis]|uniref:DUF1572 family protein n=1 Tax=Deinococcus oregonensis TaxID=1805970 RepID=A0ABV6AX84_9DEIO